MKNISIAIGSLLCLFISQAANSQMAIIRDRDGFVHVRAGIGLQHKVKDTIRNGRIVFLMGDEGEWINIDYNRKGEQLTGFIHRSRVLPMDSLTQFSAFPVNDSVSVFRLDPLKLEVSVGVFNPSASKLSYSKKAGESNILVTINGKPYYGKDGDIPDTRYKGIRWRENEKAIAMPGIWLNDLFQPSLSTTQAYADKKTGLVYLISSNSDGAGSYEVAWILLKGKVLGRELFYGF